ncbi:MAG: F0F1 ATP synthase subunit B [Arcobacter sp.]|nr:F0F1 ATP synthase subunit B [Arcobacter sp.]
MKRIFLLGLVALAPVALFASEGAETNYDIVQRTVNFIIFAAILWYLLADKIKAFFANRTLSIQAELDKVQDTLKASQDKVADAQKKLEEAKKLAAEIVESAKADVDSVKQKVAVAVDTDIANLNKNLDEMMKVELSKAKKQVVTEVLEELLSSDNIKLTQSELVNIVLKKVA